MSALVLLVLTQFPLDVFENSTAFEKLDVREGITMSQREVKASVYREYRAEVATPYPVDALCEAIYDWGTRHPDGPAVTLNTVLQDGEDLRVVYSQITQPIVSRRDYALTVQRERLPDGTCRIRFRTTNEAAPPKPEGFVRMDKLWGEWRMAAGPEGKSTLTYTLFSDPSGSVPPFLVHGAQKNATRDALVMAVKKTKRFVEGAK